MAVTARVGREGWAEVEEEEEEGIRINGSGKTLIKYYPGKIWTSIFTLTILTYNRHSVIITLLKSNLIIQRCHQLCFRRAINSRLT